MQGVRVPASATRDCAALRRRRLSAWPKGCNSGDVLAYFKTSLSWSELFKRTVRETQADNGLGLAAQLAYYFFLALFPALLFLIALAGLFASADVINQIVAMMGGAAPPDVIAIVREQLLKLAESDQGGIMTFGALAALWSSSAAMVALIDALNRAYDVEDARPWWRQRLTAILLTIGVAAFIVLSFALVVAGPELASSVADRFGLGTAFEWTWTILQWPIVFALVAFAFGLIYYFAPDVDQDWVFLTPGSVLATALWLVGSLGFRFYVVNFGSYNETYGAIGGVMVLMLWLYISGLVVVIGAEMNAEIEHASPYGKAPGEKRPGERTCIGPRAEREFFERRRRARPEPFLQPADLGQPASSSSRGSSG
ncbi:MAG: YihY/virulence factor BrkB family protein [Acidobacteria bacterium]|nr:YihY/virulence factor BrkB family protein [Acidobacteriota bacterium]